MTEEELKTEPAETKKRGPGRPKKKVATYNLIHHRKGCNYHYATIMEGGSPSDSIEKLHDYGYLETELKIGMLIRGVAVCPQCGYQLTTLESATGPRFWGNDRKVVK